MTAVNKLKLAELIGVFVRMRPRMERVARMRTGSHALSEDLIQDVWLRLENSPMGERIENPAGFLTHVANTTIAGHMRKERRRAEIDLEISELIWETSDEISPERLMIGRENLKTVHAALDDLSEKTRRIFLMNRIEGISHRRIAEMLGVSDETVYYHIRRALERLATLRDEIAD
ncbi:RNA polymerase sigma factor [Neorhizobium alkalisoli]|nr:RNA polymerase sigma factor [Neorhizobium alkalisoli]